MPDAPLSRRARRTFEEEAADRAAIEDSTSALAQAPTTSEVRAVENERSAVLSRRDRRRMERLNHPLEAWTAEEEMLATGQIPVMTPERIAEQERISREKAEKAAEEAVAASQELRRLQASDIRQAPEPVAEEPASLPSAPPSQAFQPLAFPSPAFPAPAPQAPASFEPAAQPQWSEEAPTEFPGDFEFAAKPSWPEETVPPVQTPPGFPLPASQEAAPVVDQAADGHEADGHEADGHEAGTHSSRPVLEPYQPVMALDDKPLVPVVHPTHDEAPVETDEEAADESATHRSDVFNALFPPGSRQAALRHQDPFAAGSPQEHAPIESGQIPILLPPQEVPERKTNPADEIRRLAAEAMSSMERASKSDEDAAAAAGPLPDPSVSAEFDSLQSESARNAASTDAAPDGGAPNSAQPPTPPAQQAPSIARTPAEFARGEEADSSPSANRADGSPSFDSLGDWSQSAGPTPSTPSGGVTLQHAGFDQQTQPASGQFPMPGQQTQPASGQFPMPGQQGQPAPQAPAGPQGPAWNSPPVNAEPGRAAEAEDFTPLSDVPKPDFSGLYKQGSPAAFPPLTGAINNAALDTAEFHDGDMTPSGQVPAIRRPDLPEVGGVKHFKWVHLSVIGALMFVLGVVIYNVAFHR